jgi:hypothetical protein
MPRLAVPRLPCPAGPVVLVDMIRIGLGKLPLAPAGAATNASYPFCSGSAPLIL